jgi:hypothetical protein
MTLIHNLPKCGFSTPIPRIHIIFHHNLSKIGVRTAHTDLQVQPASMKSDTNYFKTQDYIHIYT